ncbi:MAG: ankyrin repeat domain-containing protein [Deltaproteobacteria bacterium]|nr:ankyrin repeat domain-containing protein [Deltaproteobacteria bacterium]
MKFKVLCLIMTLQSSLAFGSEDAGLTPFEIAMKNRHFEAVKFLVSNGADVNVANIDGETPLHWAARNGHLETIKCLVNDCGAGVNAADSIGWTPLFWAARNGHTDIVEFLKSYSWNWGCSIL